MNDARCCAYSFLKEESRMCDYEILTDQLASDNALAVHFVKHNPELAQLTELIYHCNGSIRGKLAIQESDFLWLNQLYDQLLEPIHQFVVPQGSLGACWLHRLRTEAKAAVRLAYQIEREGHPVPQRLLDFLNLLSNVYFQMALRENRQENVAEIPFVSRSYL